jgi:hypothetical protein
MPACHCVYCIYPLPGGGLAVQSEGDDNKGDREEQVIQELIQLYTIAGNQ